MEKFIIRYVLCGVLLWLSMGVAMFGKNLTSSACPLKSFEGDLINHPYPLDNKCVMLKHFENLKQILYADLCKNPDKNFMLMCKINTIESKIDSINAAPFSFFRVKELTLGKNEKFDYRISSLSHMVDSHKLQSNLLITAFFSFLSALLCLFFWLKPNKNIDDLSSTHFGIGFAVFLFFSIILVYAAL